MTENRLALTVYTTGPTCQACKATKRRLDARGIQYHEVNTQEDENAAELVKKMGYSQAPVVVVPFDWDSDVRHWSGYRPDLIDAIK